MAKKGSAEVAKMVEMMVALENSGVNVFLTEEGCLELEKFMKQSEGKAKKSVEKVG